MKLEIHNCDDIGFILYLIKQIQNYLDKNVEEKKLQKIKLYIDNVEQYSAIKDQNVSIRQIIIFCGKNLVYKKSKDGYTIQLNNNVYYPETDIKLESILKLIEYGTLSVRGSFYFHKAYKYIIDNLDYLWDEYESR